MVGGDLWGVSKDGDGQSETLACEDTNGTGQIEGWSEHLPAR